MSGALRELRKSKVSEVVSNAEWTIVVVPGVSQFDVHELSGVK